MPALLFSRPPDLGGPPPRKAVLSMNGLSYGVIRVDTEEKLSVLTVQDVGQVMPGGEKQSVHRLTHSKSRNAPGPLDCLLSAGQGPSASCLLEGCWDDSRKETKHH